MQSTDSMTMSDIKNERQAAKFLVDRPTVADDSGEDTDNDLGESFVHQQVMDKKRKQNVKEQPWKATGGQKSGEGEAQDGDTDTGGG